MNEIIYYQNKIREFENKIGPDMSYNDIQQNIFKLVNGIPLPVSASTWNKGKILYRARMLTSSNLNDLKKWKKSDFWEVPKSLVKTYGRLNKPNESIMYLSNDLKQTLHEIHYHNQCPVVISKFIVNREFNSANIGHEYVPKKINDESKVAIQNLFTDLFRRQFSFPVGKGTEYLYKFSNVISKDYYDLPPEMSQAWLYPAIENKNALNVGFKSGIAEKYLKYDGSIVVRKVTDEGFSIPLFFDENYNLNQDYHTDKNIPKNDWINRHFSFNFKYYK